MTEQTWTGAFSDYLDRMVSEIGSEDKTDPGDFYSEKEQKKKQKKGGFVPSFDDIALIIGLMKPLFESTGKTIWDVYGKPTGGAVGEADETEFGTNKPWEIGPRIETPFEEIIRRQRELLR